MMICAAEEGGAEQEDAPAEALGRKLLRQFQQLHPPGQ